MIKLLELQQKEIRTEIIGSDIWFSGQDVFNALGLTWKGSICLKDRNITGDRIKIISTKTNGGIQKMTFINKEAVAQVSLMCRKLDSIKRNYFLNSLNIQESDLKINAPERIFVNSLIPILEGFGVDYFEQYNIGKYKVDIYVPIIGFIEYDESNGHNKEKDLFRESEIKKIQNKPFYRCTQGKEKDFLKMIVCILTSIGVNMLCTKIKKEIDNGNNKKVEELLNIYTQ